MQPMLNTAIQAARKAGQLVHRATFQSSDKLKISEKQQGDFVTDIDILAERTIIDIIKTAYPDHLIYAEEETQEGEGEYRWIIDPLDGTINFIHGLPHFGISIALEHKGKLVVGVIYDPIRDELFTALRGSGAKLNEHRIRVSGQVQLQKALLGTGFPFKNKELLENYLKSFQALFQHSVDVRRAGAACLDLAYLACGRLDGFWEAGLSYWGTAAGILLVKEAGGLITDFSGAEYQPQQGNIIACSPKLLKPMLQAIKPYFP